MEINVHAAKTHFSKLLQRVALGEEITIAKSGVPIARLVPVSPSREVCEFGLARGSVWIADDFDAPLPNSILAGFYGDKKTPKRK